MLHVGSANCLLELERGREFTALSLLCPHLAEGHVPGVQ